MYLPEKGYKRVLVLTFYIALGVTVAYFFFKYLFIGLLPFLIGWLIARFLQPPVNFLHEKAHLPKKFTSIVLVLIALGALGTLLYLIVAKLYSEAVGLAATLPRLLSGLPEMGNSIIEYLENMFKNVPYIDITETLEKLFGNLDKLIPGVWQSAYPTLAAVLKATVSGVPYTLIFIIITVISTCYLTIDYKKINGFLAAQLPGKAYSFLLEFKEQFFSTTWKYFRAYSLIILITFFELYIGFSIIKVEYAFALAVLVAIIDILPVLGTGTVLIPWAIVELITRDIKTGITLLVIYAVITVVRQIIEPKIVGSYIGLYPLFTLLCMYIGVRLIGIGGLFAFPILAIILKNLNDKGIIHIYNNPPPEEVSDAKTKFKRFKKHDSNK